MNETRQQILAHVKSNPGVHFNGIVRDIDIATGQAQYHLRRLIKGGELEDESINGRTHYFSPEFDPWERRALALLRRETSRNVIALGLRDGSVPAPAVADELDVARSTVTWHLSNLEEAGIVRTDYGPDGKLSYEIVDPARTRDLLGMVTPSLSDQLIDRFGILLDRALNPE